MRFIFVFFDVCWTVEEKPRTTKTTNTKFIPSHIILKWRFCTLITDLIPFRFVFCADTQFHAIWWFCCSLCWCRCNKNQTQLNSGRLSDFNFIVWFIVFFYTLPNAFISRLKFLIWWKVSMSRMQYFYHLKQIWFYGLQNHGYCLSIEWVKWLNCGHNFQIRNIGPKNYTNENKNDRKKLFVAHKRWLKTNGSQNLRISFATSSVSMQVEALN